LSFEREGTAKGIHSLIKSPYQNIKSPYQYQTQNKKGQNESKNNPHFAHISDYLKQSNASK
jgi:hypothetical protein